jgi:hypothetical protein
MNDIEVQSKFVAELQALLIKYKVEMSIDRDSDDIEFWAYAQYDNDGNVIAEHIDYHTGWMCWKDE